MNSYWAQVDVELAGQRCRFFMDDCGGRDQVVRAIHRSGWRGYEPPLPLLIARLTRSGPCVFIDVGANTGYYSLLAAAFGARQVWAFEPVPSIRTIFAGNVRESALDATINVSDHALGEEPGRFEMYLPDAGHGLIETSASLNPGFRQTHSGQFQVTVSTLDILFLEQPRRNDGAKVVMKIDVESLEPQVLKGGRRFVETFRPTIVIEILPGTDVGFFEDFARRQNYAHFWLNPNNQLDDTGGRIEVSLVRRDHLFVPREQLQEFAHAMTQR